MHHQFWLSLSHHPLGKPKNMCSWECFKAIEANDVNLFPRVFSFRYRRRLIQMKWAELARPTYPSARLNHIVNSGRIMSTRNETTQPFYLYIHTRMYMSAIYLYIGNRIHGTVRVWERARVYHHHLASFQMTIVEAACDSGWRLSPPSLLCKVF